MTPLLLDAGLPRGSALDLRGAGWDATHVADCGLAAAPDAAILSVAEREGRAVVTLDNDFPQLLYLAGAARPSIILMRLEGLDRHRATSVLLRLVPRVLDDLRAGAIVSVTADSARVRLLPLR